VSGEKKIKITRRSPPKKKPEQQKQPGRHPILDADHLVVRGENVFPKKARIMMMGVVVGVVPGLGVGVRAHGSVWRRWLIRILKRE
jgi:hypothetical protein